MADRPSKPFLDGLPTAVSSVAGESGSMIRRLGFWTAILLPALYVPLVLISHPWVVDAANFAKVIGLHVASIVIGNGHAGSADRE